MEIIKMVVLLSWTLGCAAPSSQQDGFPAAAARMLRRVRLPPERLRAVPHVVRDLERTLQSHWPGTEVTPFGAIIAGLGIVDSDVDCFAKLPFHDRTIFEVKNILDRYPHLFHRPQAVQRAKMPHVRFVHAPTGYQCDVSFRHMAGVRNTALVNYLMRLDRRTLDLTTIVKYWMKLHKPPGVKRIMPNYATVSLVIFYLQQVNMLPSIASLQEDAEKIIIERWNTGFNEMPFHSSNNDTLFELLGGFFQYYDKFDFKDMIVSIFNGTPIKRSVFENIETVPDAFTLYKRNVANDNVESLNIKTAICVQDVFLHHINIASETSPEVLSKFKSDLRFAVDAFANAKDNFLEVILEPDMLVDKQTRVNYWLNSTSPTTWKSCNIFQTQKQTRVPRLQSLALEDRNHVCKKNFG